MSCKGECWENGATRCVDCDPPKDLTVVLYLPANDALALGETLRALAQTAPLHVGALMTAVGGLMSDAARANLALAARPATSVPESEDWS